MSIDTDECSMCDILEQRLAESQKKVWKLQRDLLASNLMQDHWRIRCERAEDRVIQLEDAIIKEIERQDYGKLLSLLLNSPISHRDTD